MALAAIKFTEYTEYRVILLLPTGTPSQCLNFHCRPMTATLLAPYSQTISTLIHILFG